MQAHPRGREDPMHERSEEREAVVAAVRSFVEREVRPEAAAWEEAHAFPASMWRRMGELGLLGVTLPEAYGGAGADLLTGALVGAELAKGSASLALSYGAHSNLCAHNLARNGTDDQRRRWLPGLCRGDLVGCMALTEPGAGSDAVGITTRAVPDGDSFVLNGRKTFITNGPIADLALVYAKTDPEAGPRGITAFLVERGTPGFSTSRALAKLGHRASPTGDLVFEDCRVPAQNVLGGVNRGIAVMMSGLDIERAFFACGAVGLAERAFELAVAYARERRQFGRPLGSFQLIQAKIADMFTEIEAARLLAGHAARMADRAASGGAGTEVHKVAAAALLFAAETAQRVVDHAVQIHGGYGYCDEYEVSRLYRDVRLFTIGAGTSEIRRLVIAEEVLRA